MNAQRILEKWRARYPGICLSEAYGLEVGERRYSNLIQSQSHSETSNVSSTPVKPGGPPLKISQRYAAGRRRMTSA